MACLARCVRNSQSDLLRMRGAYRNVDAGAANVWAEVGELRRAAMTPEESIHYRLETDAGSVEWQSILPRGRGVVFLNSSIAPSYTPFEPRAAFIPRAASDSEAAEAEAETPKAYRVAMFHQLECLNVIREEMVLRHSPSSPSSSTSQSPSSSSSSSPSDSTPNPNPNEPRAQFCLTYLLESILCHGDSHLENVRSEFEFGGSEIEGVSGGSEIEGESGGRPEVVLGTERTDCVDWEEVWRGVERSWEAFMNSEAEV